MVLLLFDFFRYNILRRILVTSLSFYIVTSLAAGSLQWRYNGRDGVSNHQPHHCLLNLLFRCRSKKTSKLRVTGFCAGNSQVTGEFRAQMASNAENVSIWWRHHYGCEVGASETVPFCVKSDECYSLNFGGYWYNKAQKHQVCPSILEHILSYTFSISPMYVSLHKWESLFGFWFKDVLPVVHNWPNTLSDVYMHQGSKS